MKLVVATANLRRGDADSGAHSWANRLPLVAEFLTRRRPAVVGVQEALLEQLAQLTAHSGLSGTPHPPNTGPAPASPRYRWVGEGRRGGGEDEHSAIVYDVQQLRPVPVRPVPMARGGLLGAGEGEGRGALHSAGTQQRLPHGASSPPSAGNGAAPSARTPLLSGGGDGGGGGGTVGLCPSGVVGAVGWGSCCPRVATWCRFEVLGTRGCTVIVCNTHLDHQSAEARARGSEAIGELLAGLRAANPAEPVIVTGDFNCTRASAVHKWWLDPAGGGMRDAWLDAAEAVDNGSTTTFHMFKGLAIERPWWRCLFAVFFGCSAMGAGAPWLCCCPAGRGGRRASVEHHLDWILFSNPRPPSRRRGLLRALLCEVDTVSGGDAKTFPSDHWFVLAHFELDQTEAAASQASVSDPGRRARAANSLDAPLLPSTEV